MNADKSQLLEADLTERVIGAFFTVHKELGHGFLESVYENSLVLALREMDLTVVQQAPLQVTFHQQVVGEFRADVLIEGRLIVEIKAVSKPTAVHETQLVNYLQATGVRVGLLPSFGPVPEFKRRVFDLASNHPRQSTSIRVNPRPKKCLKKY